MKAILFLLLFVATASSAQTQAITLDCGTNLYCNTKLILTLDNPTVVTPHISFLRKLEWSVNGRRILVYPGTSGIFDYSGHQHPDLHVTSTQDHLRGPMWSNPDVIGGVVHSIYGDFKGGPSRLTEKLDVENKSDSDVAIWLTGMGYKPTQSNLEVPDLSGIDVYGTTVVFYTTTSITEMPYGKAQVSQFIPFIGFNPIANDNYVIPAHATMTMITELYVGDRRLPPPVK